MRTTIDIPDEQRARLMDIAARRGEKGFSRIVAEALERYLEQELHREDEIEQARRLRGTLSGAEIDEIAEEATRLRQSWR